MVSAAHRSYGLANSLILFQILCLSLTSIRSVSAFPQAGDSSNGTVAVQAATSAATTQSNNPDDPLNFPTIAPPTRASSSSAPGQAASPKGSGSVPGSGVPIPFTPLVVQSTDEFLKPSPTSSTDNPGGRNEITEPNLTATAPCRGCSPVIQISVSGLDFATTPAAELIASTLAPTTIAAGSTSIAISQAPDGTSFVIGSTTVAAGQTVTVDNTPIAIQTTVGRTQVVVGSKTVSLKAQPADSTQGQITEAPIPPVITIAGQTYTANPSSQFVIGTQTLTPGGAPVIISGTTISLLPSATAVVINGQTSILQNSGPAAVVFTTTSPPVLTINGRTYTANAATQYVLGPGTTLTPGGQVTISGTVISLAPSETALVIAGSTSSIAPAVTVVTLMTPATGGTLRTTISLQSGSAAQASRSSAGAGKNMAFGSQPGHMVSTQTWVIPVAFGFAVWVGILAIWL